MLGKRIKPRRRHAAGLAPKNANCLAPVVKRLFYGDELVDDCAVLGQERERKGEGGRANLIADCAVLQRNQQASKLGGLAVASVACEVVSISNPK